jgi:sodium-dependent dicarboxylate transporter 2/3/5
VVGSPPNAIAAAHAGIGFAEWMRIGLPMVALLWPLMLLVLWALLRPRFGAACAGPAEEAGAFAWTGSRLATLAVFALTAAGWVFAAPLARVLGVDADVDSLVALAAIVALAALRLVDWDAAERQVQWGVLLLFGGGLALGAVMERSGASRFLADAVVGALAGAPTLVLLLGVVAFVVMLTELVSNTASAALLVPVFGGVGAALGLPPLLLAAGIAVAASCAFMLPVATPPNAIVYGSGLVPQRTMVRCGLVLNVVCIVVIVATLEVLVA